MFNSIKKIFIYVPIITFVLSLLSNVSAISLQIPDEHAQPDIAVVWPTQIEANESDLFNIINLVNDYLWFSIWAICMWALVYGWILLITSQWSDDKMKKANKILVWALVGILISIFSYAIVRIVVNLL